MAHLKPKTLHLLGLSPTGDIGPFTMYTTRRGNPVWFPRAPPLSPPSTRQVHERNRWIVAAMRWKALPPAEQKNWKRAAQRVHLKITHYNLFMYYVLTDDEPVIRTVEHNSKIQLLPLGCTT